MINHKYRLIYYGIDRHGAIVPESARIEGEYYDNPLERITEVWDKWEPEIKQIASWGEHTLKAEMAQAIQKCMEIKGQGPKGVPKK